MTSQPNESACLRLVCLDISASSDSGGIAQLVERLVRNEKVRGSNPLTSTTGREHKRLRSRFNKRHGAWPRILTRSDRSRHVREPSERIKLGLR